MFILTTATSSSSWIIADGFNEGLFVTCIGEDAPSPLPFNMDYIDVGCGKKRPSEILKMYPLSKDLYKGTGSCKK